MAKTETPTVPSPTPEGQPTDEEIAAALRTLVEAGEIEIVRDSADPAKVEYRNTPLFHERFNRDYPDPPKTVYTDAELIAVLRELVAKGERELALEVIARVKRVPARSYPAS